MKTHSGDVFIRPYAGHSVQLLDADTREQLAIVSCMERGIALAAQWGGAVWNENADSHGRPLGPPMLLVAKHLPPDAPVPRPIDNRAAPIQRLRALHAKWMSELHQLLTVDMDRAFELAQALDDLAVVLAGIESREDA
jgi:hypothetical protein